MSSSAPSTTPPDAPGPDRPPDAAGPADAAAEPPGGPAASEGPPGATRAAGASPAGDRLTRRGRRIRTAVTVVVGALLMVGTFWGSDDSFPFGPFRMYAHTNKPDGVVRSTRVEAVDVTGRRFKLSDGGSGLRRAELEGQLPRFQESPELLGELVRAYQQRHPGAPEVVLVEIHRRSYHLEDGSPTGEHRDDLLARWEPPDAGSGAAPGDVDGARAGRPGGTRTGSGT